MRRLVVALPLLLTTGCWQSFILVDDAVDGGPVDAPTCPAAPPFCVRTADDPCLAPVPVDPTCNPTTLAWSCPAPSRIDVGVAGEPPVCRPFHDPSMGLSLLAGSLVRVPTTDGRCLWIADSVTPGVGGGEVSNVAFVPDITAPFGSCPTRAPILGGTLASSVVIEGSGGPDLIVQIDGGYLAGGVSHVLYRLFRLDPMGGFGVTELGTGVGRWDPTTQKIVVPGPTMLRWDTSLDLGDAYLPAADTTYVWGCPGPPMFLTEQCVLGRLDASDAMQLWSTSGAWITSSSASDAAMQFGSGPWISSVFQQGGSYVHLYSVGFGTFLQTHTATQPEGPWTDTGHLAPCDVAPGDAHSYCAGPVVHEELRDPTRPGELVVSYGVGSTDGATAIALHPDDYWTRLVWVRSP